MKPRAQLTSTLRIGLMALTCAAPLLAGCSEVLPTTSHPAVAQEQVKIYTRKPAKYELLGTVEVPVTADMKWDERGDSSTGFVALKTKAGALGGNGLLLLIDEKHFDTKVGAGYNGTYYLVPLRLQPRTAVAEAIYVVKE
jgi:hypothetical protein